MCGLCLYIIHTQNPEKKKEEEKRLREEGRRSCTKPQLTRSGPADGLGDFRHVHDDRLDAVALALHFGANPGHLVAVEGVRHIPVHVHGPHGCCGHLIIY